jgi:hypothetical protein
LLGSKKKRSTPATWNDPDDAPELTADFFKSADVYEGNQLKARGRPKSATPKEPGFFLGQVHKQARILLLIWACPKVKVSA